MMDKIVVTAADIEKLLAWRDEHNDLVRSMPAGEKLHLLWTVKICMRGTSPT